MRLPHKRSPARISTRLKHGMLKGRWLNTAPLEFVVVVVVGWFVDETTPGVEEGGEGYVVVPLVLVDVDEI